MISRILVGLWGCGAFALILFGLAVLEGRIPKGQGLDAYIATLNRRDTRIGYGLLVGGIVALLVLWLAGRWARR